MTRKKVQGDRPEMKVALSILLEALPNERRLEMTELPTGPLETGFKAFFPFAVRAAQLPHAPDWKWRQNCRRKTIKLPGGQSVVLMKLSPRILDGRTGIPPKAKAWLAWVTKDDREITFLWAERGTATPVGMYSNMHISSTVPGVTLGRPRGGVPNTGVLLMGRTNMTTQGNFSSIIGNNFENCTGPRLLQLPKATFACQLETVTAGETLGDATLEGADTWAKIESALGLPETPLQAPTTVRTETGLPDKMIDRAAWSAASWSSGSPSDSIGGPSSPADPMVADYLYDCLLDGRGSDASLYKNMGSLLYFCVCAR